MIAEINNGFVNALLLRPSSFYEYHLGQLLGQKLITALTMTPVVIFIAWLWNLPFHLERLPLVLITHVTQNTFYAALTGLKFSFV